MNTTLLVLGLACVIAAIVGGGLKAAGFEFPAVASLRRQLLLAALGVVLIFVSRPGMLGALSGPPEPADPSKHNGSAHTETNTGTRTAQLRDSSYDLPGQGVKNENRSIGGFCCTGETATILTADKQPVGYVYVFDWPGQALDVSGETMVPGLTIRVSGANVLAPPSAVRQVSSVVFLAEDVSPGAKRDVKVGALGFTVTVTRARRQQINGHWYVDLPSARIHVTATAL